MLYKYNMLLSYSWMKFISLFGLVLSPLLCMSSMNWFMVWFSLELSTVCFIFLCLEQTNISSNSMFKYFFIQSLSSVLFLYFVLAGKLFYVDTMFEGLVLLIMSMKLGLFPFQWWLSDVAEGLNWFSFFIFNTWQKLIPLMIISFLKLFLNFIIMSSSLVGLMYMYNQVSIRKILVYSGLLHSSWMLMFMPLNMSGWYVYMWVYMVLMYFFWGFLKMYNFSSIYQSAMICFFKTKLYWGMLWLSLGGLPPFLGFWPKWLVLINFNYMNMLIIIILIMTSLVSCFIYLRFIVPCFNYNLVKKFKQSNYSSGMICNLMMLLIICPLIK